MGTPEKTSLLVVEDEPMLLAMLKEYFEQQGFQVVAVRGVEKAMDILGSGEIDVVMTDLCLGQLRDGGLSVAAAASDAGVPTLLITAFPEETIQKDPRFARVAALVHKPVSCRTIQNLLTTLVKPHEPALTDTQQLLRQYAPWLLVDGISQPEEKVTP